MRRQSRRPSLWAAVWFVYSTNNRAKNIYVFTVADSRAEAKSTMRDGVMGLSAIDGSSIEPESIWRVPHEDAPVSMALYLARNGYQFIAPYKRMTPESVGGLVARLTI